MRTAKIMETKITMKRKKSILRGSDISLILTDASASTTRKIVITEIRVPDTKPIQKLIATPCPKVIAPLLLFLKNKCAKKINATLVNAIMEISVGSAGNINFQLPLMGSQTKARHKADETTPPIMP